MSIMKELVSGEELVPVKKEKVSEYVFEKIKSQMLDEYLSKGWEIDRELKSGFKMKKKKSHDEIFENDVWLLFYALGFETFNCDRNFRIPYSKDETLTQQIDVFAMDDETILIVECKASEEFNKSINLKTDIEAINGKNKGIRDYLRKYFPKHKVKFILATRNYLVSEHDKKRMREFNIEFFDEDKMDYYSELSKHLGTASRYQLLGNLFAGQKINGIKNIIPAISGTMGGHVYYSFSIEPEILLKLGYVLHRNDSNKDLNPTYQRIIKKSRLKQVQNFVDSGGYFPNSIIVSINSGNRKLKFERVNQEKSVSKSKIGLLYLPQVYQSIFIIDGQHRLYGYADSKYRKTNTIPVVAFENLEPQEQIKIFMDINENQKPVPKNLRNTLEENLNYNSPNNVLNRKALGLRVARSLGEEKDSPLYNRILIGENTKSENRDITLESISSALQKSEFFSKYDKKNQLILAGTFDKEVNDATFKKLYQYLQESFRFIITETGEFSNGRTLITNPGVYAVIKICNDIINYLKDGKVINPLHDNVKDTIKYSNKYLKYVSDSWKSMSEQDYKNLKSRYGDGGKTRYWRLFQKFINDNDKDFNPEGMKSYWDENNRDNYRKAQSIIADIEGYFKNDIRNTLEKAYGTKKWMKQGIPKKLFMDLNDRANQKNYDIENIDDEVEPWDCMYLINYKEILEYNWGLFELNYTWPGNENKRKSEKIKWFFQLNEIRNKCAHKYVASNADLEFLKELKDWKLK